MFHAVNSLLRGHDAAQDAVEIVNAWTIVGLGSALGLVWLASRPRQVTRTKLAVASATLSALLGLLVAAILGRLWYHPRPFVDHPRDTVLLVRHAPDNSFPSDHATVAFAIAVAVFLFHRRLGLVFLAGATSVAAARVLVGVHYPVDVLAGALAGASSAGVVATAGRPWATWLANAAGRVTDPVVEAAWRKVARARRPPRP